MNPDPVETHEPTAAAGPAPIDARSSVATAASAERGFTLLEIMAVVGLLGLVILPILGVREQSSQRAYRASRMVLALNYAEQVLADAMLMIEEQDEQIGVIEDDPQFEYTLTIKEFDLSTGLHLDEDYDDDFYQDDPDATQAYQPGDSGGSAEEDDDEERDSPHRVRRYSIEVRWPRWDAPAEDSDEDAFDRVVLEGFVPRYWEDEEEEPEDEGGLSGGFGR